MKVSRQPRAENLDTHYAQLQETRPVASPQVSMVSHLVNSWCLNCTYTVSEERTVASPQVRRRWLRLRGFPTASVVSPPGNSTSKSSEVSTKILECFSHSPVKYMIDDSNSNSCSGTTSLPRMSF